jgi:hypothetical protein
MKTTILDKIIKIKCCAIVIFLFSPFFVEAHDHKLYCEIIDRNEEGKLVARQVDAQGDLDYNLMTHHFGPFIIVKGEAEDAKNLATLEKSEQTRVCNLAYHLKKARSFFINELKAPVDSQKSPLIVRYELNKPFDTYEKYDRSGGDRLGCPAGVCENNASTVKPSHFFRNKSIPAWDFEIWFRPMNVKPQPKQTGQLATQDLFESSLGVVDTAVVEVTKLSSLGVDPKYIDTSHYVSQFKYVLLLTQVVPLFVDFTYSQIPSYFGFDASMIPDIIYHEYSHIATADKLPVNNVYTVLEGLANYFASLITDNDVLYDELDEFAKNLSPIKVKENRKYSYNLEVYNNLIGYDPFVYSYLRLLRRDYSEYFPQDDIRIFDRLMFELRHHIDLAHHRTVSHSLTNGLKKTAQVFFKNQPAKARIVTQLIVRRADRMGM